jgi:uncharacterized protein YbbK (DUF523 family)
MKIKLGISSCLLGENVRYDGGHKLDHYLRDTLGQFVEWVPVCPEVECGLPVPREAMQLVRGASSRSMMTVLTSVDHTERVLQWAEHKLAALENQGLCGFVFKARSPSCAIADAELFTPSGTLLKKGPGVFAQLFMERFPPLPVEDEERLHDAAARERFFGRAFLCAENNAG